MLGGHRWQRSRGSVNLPTIACWHAWGPEVEAQQRIIKQYIHISMSGVTGGGAAEGLDYAGALAQQAFATIAAAAEDVASVFQKDAPELGAVLLVWSLHEAERFCTLIKRNALSPFAAPAGEDSSPPCPVPPLAATMSGSLHEWRH